MNADWGDVIVFSAVVIAVCWIALVIYLEWP